MAGVKKLLIIAGSDSGGGAGIQADLKSASARGVYAATAITAITAQNTLGVQAAQMLPADLVASQIEAVLTDIGADAVKIGMLGDPEIVAAVADSLAPYRGPIVLDPVMVAKSGDALLSDAAILALRDRLLPMAALLTPNLPEAARLLGTRTAETEAEVIAQGETLRGMGAGAVLMKGGHASGEICTDWMIGGRSPQPFTAPRISTTNTHGTGCSMSSAIAAELAKGSPMAEAVATAHGWLHEAIKRADSLKIGAGHGPIHHFHEVWA